MKYEYSSALVTGGAGFIGSHIVDVLINAGFEVTVLDDLSTGRLKNISDHLDAGKINFIKGDIRDRDLIKKILKDKEVIFHEAAIADAEYSIKCPKTTNDVNVTGTLNLLECCLNSDVKRFIYASSASVYGDKNIQPMNEGIPLEPTTPYGASKAASEHYVRLFHELHGLETFNLRYFNAYGPRSREDQGVMSIFLHKLMKNERPLIYGDGEQRLDYINVKDISRANMLALSSKSGLGESINIGTGSTTSVNELARKLIETLDKRNIKPLNTNPRQGDVRLGYADTKKARVLLKFHAEISIEQGIKELVEWYEKSIGSE